MRLDSATSCYSRPGQHAAFLGHNLVTVGFPDSGKDPVSSQPPAGTLFARPSHTCPALGQHYACRVISNADRNKRVRATGPLSTVRAGQAACAQGFRSGLNLFRAFVSPTLNADCGQASVGAGVPSRGPAQQILGPSIAWGSTTVGVSRTSAKAELSSASDFRHVVPLPLPAKSTRH